jgi:hypothetical protein
VSVVSLNPSWGLNQVSDFVHAKFLEQVLYVPPAFLSAVRFDTMHAKAIELLVTAIAGAIIGMIGFAGLWYGTRQKERAHKTSESSGEFRLQRIVKS